MRIKNLEQAMLYAVAAMSSKRELHVGKIGVRCEGLCRLLIRLSVWYHDSMRKN